MKIEYLGNDCVLIKERGQ
ncbi:rCG61806 [Rattus norvegicus]|uniref:RCG61806 n=1 Tax=Rattus norvegicus TaxID=10116 RepID=A6HAQ1_RAT|nr:rCG61806 [Rattus norvegicus]